VFSSKCAACLSDVTLCLVVSVLREIRDGKESIKNEIC
jgi:hypothetical protein